jgi:hypothetical protein
LEKESNSKQWITGFLLPFTFLKDCGTELYGVPDTGKVPRCKQPEQGCKVWSSVIGGGGGNPISEVVNNVARAFDSAIIKTG